MIKKMTIDNQRPAFLLSIVIFYFFPPVKSQICDYMCLNQKCRSPKQWQLMLTDKYPTRKGDKIYLFEKSCI